MSIDLEAINRRYEAALDARPAKGEWTSAQAAILADSVADVKPLMHEVEELREQIAREIEEAGNQSAFASTDQFNKWARAAAYARAARIARGQEQD